ncbi:aspartate aminotransferase family protein [Paenactinomyces guangxiensis]|uniref:Diaminobutyrate--2-oxoglutarate transaminase n=1 Tax=Paenactinomyces guangxiensis TaxID=1490290 RepID=A0A7W1WU60_9BACL|nr:aspartate aminotransferase family protein [Paenactinomyces guangxiensis]MBA4496119.1 aspartate aminotransferase family protein [Paenactinomyces guangxiensis]MBH8593207.1 aspartate aminotransferase family protein [Paenactinomyces guangxiensis]
MSPAQVLNNQHYLSSQERRESNARSYPRRIPIAIKEAVGITVKDVEGKTYFDCLSGAGTLALGHNHPVVIEAIQQVLTKKLPLHTLDITTPVKEEFVEELFNSLPKEFASRAKIQFCGPAGADAVEAALKIVKTATGRRSILSYQGAYHGMTHGSLSLTGNTGPKEPVSGLMSDVHFLPYPYSYRCPFGQGGKTGEQICSQYIEHVLNDPESGITTPAGMIMEIVQGEGGVIPAPDEWVRNIRTMTRRREIPLIVDEVQTGLGRTGKLFAFEHSGIVPDVLVLSKAIGGSLPLAVVIYDESLDQWSPGAHAGTFRGNQMAMAAGLATIRFIRNNRIDEHASCMGERLMSHLKAVQKDYGLIGDVRGRGLMIGVEIVNTRLRPDSLGSYPADPKLARQIQQECFDRGLILELGGRHGSVVRFLPPLIITPEQVDQICHIFAEAVQAAEKKMVQTASWRVNKQE